MAELETNTVRLSALPDWNSLVGLPVERMNRRAGPSSQCPAIIWRRLRVGLIGALTGRDFTLNLYRVQFTDAGEFCEMWLGRQHIEFIANAA